MTVWKLAGMFWQIERNFFDVSAEKILLTIWKRFKKQRRFGRKYFFKEDLWTRIVHCWELCAKNFVEKFSCWKTEKKTKAEASRSQEELSKKLENIRKINLHLIFFELLEAALTNLAEDFLPEKRIVFRQSPQKKQKIVFQAGACSPQNFPVDTYNAVPTGLPQL